jgi:hypothetical protein
MASINSWLGIAPVSDVRVAFTKTMNRMVVILNLECVPGELPRPAWPATA